MDNQNMIALLKSNSLVTTKDCLTDIQVNEFRYTWMIKNYEYCRCERIDQYFLETPEFTTNYGEEIRWSLQLLTKHDNKDEDRSFRHLSKNYKKKKEDYLFLQLWLLTQNHSLTQLQIELSLLNTYEEEVAIKRVVLDHTMLDDNYILKFVSRDFVFDKSNRLLDDHKLIIVCKMFFVDDIIQYVNPIIPQCRPEQLGNYNQQPFSEKIRDLVQTKNSIIMKSGLTYVKLNEFHYTWMIKNLEYWPHRSRDWDLLQSPVFTMHHEDNFSGRLILFPHGFSQNEGYMSLQFGLANRGHFFQTIHVEVSLLNIKGEALAVKQVVFENQLLCGEQLIIEDFVSRNFVFNKRNGLLCNGVLTIFCKMLFTCSQPSLHPDWNNHYHSQTIQPQQRLQQFDQYERLYLNEMFSDFKLIVGDEELPVHRNILAVRSRVFAAMLEHDTREKKEGWTEIDDVVPEVLREMLRFIYVGKVNDIKRLAPELLAAAEKYDLEDLKLACEEELISCLSIRNVKAVLKIADRYNADKLKVAAMEFAAENAKLLN